MKFNPFELGIIEKAVPTTEIQKEMWVSLQMDASASLCYNETIELFLDGEVNIEAMSFAVNELIFRHDALRSNFSKDGNYILVKEHIGKVFIFEDISLLSDLDAKYNEYKNKLQSKIVNIETDCLFHVKVFKVDNSKYRMIIYAHHIVCDGWSYAIVLNELSEFYSAKVKNRKPELEEELKFSHYSIVNKVNGKNLLCEKFWLNEYKGFIKKNAFPTDYTRPAFRTFDSKRLDFLVDSNQVEHIKKLGIKNGVSFYTTLITLFSILLKRVTKNPEVVIGLSSATQPTLENNLIVGHLVNLIPLKIEIDENSTFNTLLRSNKTKMLNAFEHQFFTFGELVKSLKNIPRINGEMPIVNIVFNIDQQAEDQGINFCNLKSSYKSVPRTHENFEIFINAVSRGNYLCLECQYNSNLFSEETIENWLMSYSKLIDIFIQHNDKSISSIETEFINIPSIKEETKQTDIEYKKNEVLENKFLQIYSNVLYFNDLKSNDNFFSVGGHSLLAIEIVNKVSEDLGINISMKDIFECPTIIQMVDRIEQSNKSHQPLKSIPIMNNLKLEQFPLSHSQLQVWYIEELDKSTTMHNLPSAILIDSKIDFNQLSWSFFELIKRHESMRTVIAKIKGRPIQKVLAFDELKKMFQLEFENISNLDTLIPILNSEAITRFNIESGPLFKAKLYELKNGTSVLFFMVHHAIWDGWCFDIFFKELNAFYTCKDRQTSHLNLPIIKYTFIEHTKWIHDQITNGDFESELSFWKNKLSSPLPLLSLPQDFKQLDEIQHIGSTFPFVLPNDLSTNLRAFAKDNSSSLFNILLSAFKITLSKYSKSELDLDDVIIGTPVRARSNNDLLNTIGYFVNTVAIRSTINHANSFISNLNTISKNALEAFEHQLLPFQVILNELDVDRENRRPPVFQAFFSFQDVSNREGVFDNHKYSQVNVEKSSTHTEIDLWIKANDSKIEGAIEFRSDLFKPETISRILENMIYLLREISNGNTNSLHRIGINEIEKNILLNDLNNTSADFDNRPFFYLIDEVALTFPNKIAIETKTSNMSYELLKSQSDNLAKHFVSIGIKSGDLIGISISRSPQMLVGILAILKTGAGYVPLDPNFPDDRIEYMYKNSRLKLILTENMYAIKFKEKAQVILIDSIDLDQNFANINLSYDINKLNTAYVIYTSGSTGLPKGVDLSHVSVSNFLQSMKQLKISSKEDKLLAVTTLSFDIAVLELYLPLISGDSIYLADASEVIDGSQLRKIIEDKKITIMQATPTTWRLLLNAGIERNKNLTVLCGGESFPIDLAVKLSSHFKRVLNMYGPTETTVWSTVKELNEQGSNLNIGRPIANTSIFILDENLNIVPMGAIGQIYIGGLGLAKGYLYRDDLTKEKFITNPFVKNELIYATGDLGKYTSEGEIVCLGRNDGQVKVRGFRIELEEIEAQLQKIENINESAVITHEFKTQDVRIVGFYNSNVNFTLLESDIKKQLGKRLPPYMIPSLLIRLDQIPKTLNGKIDKKALASLIPKNENKEPKIEVLPIEVNESDRKTHMRKIWCDVLNREVIKDSDNFFDLGGNSIIAVELMEMISNHYEVELQLVSLINSKNFNEFCSDFFSGPKKVSASYNKEFVKSFVEISSEGDSTPLVCFHAVGGNVLNYINLIPALNRKRPLHAFQSIALDGHSMSPETIESMAQQYFAELKVVQPEGPYLLAGGSMGGLIALEVARRLKLAGDNVEKLILLDTFGPDFNLVNYEINNNVSFIKRCLKSLSYRFKKILNKISISLRRFLGSKIPIKTLLFEIEDRNYKAIWKYSPKEYNGDIYLIRSKITATGWYSERNLGWGNIIKGNIYIFEIEGNHNEFIENPELINKLKKII